MIELCVKIGDDSAAIYEKLENFSSTSSRNDLENCCDLLIQLKENHQNRISDCELYDFAKIIKVNLPHTSINWINTFLYIEGINYYRALERNQDDENIEIDIFDDLENVVEDENQDEVNKMLIQLKTRVSERLYHEGII